MIQIKNISKSYDDQKVVDNLSLTIPQGTIFGFLGPNGAGKTTTMKMIVGLAACDKGKIEIGGYDLSLPRNREHIGFMPEDPYFYEHLNAMEFLKFMGELFSNVILVKAGIHQKRKRDGSRLSSVQAGMTDRERLGNLLEMVGLQDVGKKKIKDFSKGMKQRLGLAQALVNDPDYLFLDEPLDGLDPIGRLEFKKILLDLKKQNKTIFFNSHILSDVEEIANMIGVIIRGKLVYSGSIKGFCKSKTLEQRFVELVVQKG